MRNVTDRSAADKLRFTILGCGSSPGVPRINGDWGACDPKNPKNRRSRCSLLVERLRGNGENGVTRVVIDTSPDFRDQMLRAKVPDIDTVFYTHAHADHIHGIDDLRQYAIVRRAQVPIWADDATYGELETKFGYIFHGGVAGMYPPICRRHMLEEGGWVTIDGAGGPIHALAFRQTHGGIHSLGFRFAMSDHIDQRLRGGLTYSSDVSDLPDGSLPAIENSDVWILDALQYREHVSHFSLAQALAWIERLAPTRAVLTHMHIPLDYQTVKDETPAHVEPAFDGMVIEMDIEPGQ